jgi:hypothetical protein
MVVTAISLAGMVWLIFADGIALVDMLPHDLFGQIISGVLLLIVVFAGSGALWGLGLALIYDRPQQTLALAGARHWGLSAFLAALALEGINGLQNWLSSLLAVSRHVVFVSAFLIAIACVVFWCCNRIVPLVTDQKDASHIALRSGLAASFGFALVALVMSAHGWVLGRPQINGTSVMITVMLWSVLGASMAGGAALGWMISPSVVRSALQVR